ncbi:hypothetical protein CD034_00930 [Staphylococcus hominis subsp. hominis]|uniref:hypothetical protein n=1 Tax=Staphylococcus hominis TaxID=1290 RepID=UPI000CD2DF01|nr:hypothetical protein EGX58_05690 [Staphylococcus hominis]PNZ33644.1 hypothetical protein CD034_00930 [Staphylococcus hominis subsp. hominis]
MNSIVLPNVSIGNNVVIGVGNTVTKNIHNNCVYVGNPAHFIKDIYDYKKKSINFR